MTDNATIIRRILADPVAREHVKRATLAYHIDHFRHQAGAHHFPRPFHETPEAREEQCLWCGRARWQVRWDDLPPECAARPKSADETIHSVVAREEALFERVRERATKLAATLDVTTLTGAELARIHHTHGIDPSMLESAFMMTGRTFPDLHAEYETEYAKHRATGAAGFKPEIIIAKTS